MHQCQGPVDSFQVIELTVAIQEQVVMKPQSSRLLPSDSNKLLAVPRSYTARYGDINFRNNAPSLWNDLPLES